MSTIPKTGKVNIHPDAFRVIVNTYGQDTDIFLRELSSNGFNHGKCTQVNWSYDPRNGIITYTDNGIGFTSETEKYFYGIDIGESGHKENKFNRWRIGMNSVFLVADKVEVNIKSKKTGEERYIKRDIDGTYECEYTHNLKDSGVCYRLYLTDKYRKIFTIESIKNGLKKYNYWNIVHEGKRVFFNNKPISIFNGDGNISYGKYGSGNIIDGLDCGEIHKISGLESNGKSIEGDVFLDIDRGKQPIWMVKSGYLSAFVDKDFVESTRVMQSTSLIIYTNTQDETLLDALNSGKTTFKEFKSTSYYKNIMAYVQQWQDRSGVHDHETVVELLNNIINEFDITNLGSGGVTHLFCVILIKSDVQYYL